MEMISLKSMRRTGSSLRLNGFTCTILAMIALACFGVDAAYGEPLEEGVRLYREGFFEEAREIFKEYTSESRSSRDRQTAHLYLALIGLAYREEEAVRNHLSELLALDSAYELDRSEDIPPQLHEEFARIRKKLVPDEPVREEKEEKGVLAITTEPAGASVYLKEMPFAEDEDPPLALMLTRGEFKGKTPLRLSLEPGVYELSFERENYYELAAEVVIRAGREIPLKVNLLKSE